MSKRIQVELMGSNLGELKDLVNRTDPPLSLTFLANQAIKRGLPLLKQTIDVLAECDLPLPSIKKATK